MLARVLLVIDKHDLRKKVRDALPGGDVLVDVVKGKRRLWERLSREAGDLVIVSRSLIPEPPAETIRILSEAPERPDLVVIAEDEDAEERAQFLASGCETILPRDVPADVLREIFEAILAKRKEHAVKKLAAARPGGDPRLSDFVSASPAMQAFLTVVEKIVESEASILILGETGVGKERLARAIHAEGRRSAGPFIAVNCGALPESLLESELFGHEEGAFTGASRARRGWFELAHEGTVFLDEIGEMPLHLQVKLLRVLQDREIQRIGGERSINVDVRIMAATNRDLALDVEESRFRRDLFYRLSVVTLTLPALRERKEDIPTLVENFLEYFQTVIGRSVDEIDEEALMALVEYPWPGNVRELSNVIERGVLLCDASRISLGDLPESIRGEQDPSLNRIHPHPLSEARDLDPAPWLDKPLRQVRDSICSKVERAYLEAMLHETKGKIGKAAERAGITTRSLFAKMKRFGLKKEDFKG
ncbi:MAG: sigma 54-interacting transcriptional regulator [Planctomycetota bacterium]|jgi:DNA-binding NtrC family response regulator